MEILKVSNVTEIILHDSIPFGFKQTRFGILSLPLNHSVLLNVGSHVTFVGGKRSSWKNSVFILGTVNDNGSMVLLVSLNAFANSTLETSQTFLRKNDNP